MLGGFQLNVKDVDYGARTRRSDRRNATAIACAATRDCPADLESHLRITPEMHHAISDEERVAISNGLLGEVTRTPIENVVGSGTSLRPLRHALTAIRARGVVAGTICTTPSPAPAEIRRATRGTQQATRRALRYSPRPIWLRTDATSQRSKKC